MGQPFLGLTGSISRIAKVVMRKITSADSADDHFGITAEQIGKVKIGGARLPLIEGKDDLSIDEVNGNVHVVEV